RIWQNNVHEGLDARNTIKPTHHYDRRRAGIVLTITPESRPPVLSQRSQGRRKRPGNGCGLVKKLFTDEADSHSACRIARRRNILFYKRGRIRPRRQHYQLTCWIAASGIRAFGVDDSANPSRPHTPLPCYSPLTVFGSRCSDPRSQRY